MFMEGCLSFDKLVFDKVERTVRVISKQRRQGNWQKSSWKIVSVKSPKISHKNSPFIKKSLEIKSYQFETLFSRTFFWLQILYKKSPLTSENAPWKKS